MSRKRLLAAIMCGALVILARPVLVEAIGPSLVGSWQFTLAPVPPSTSGVSITGLATFTTDGSVIETDTAEVIRGKTAATTFGTPGHGIWQPSPAVPNLYVQIISLVANADSSLRARNITTMTVGLNAAGDQFSGGYTSEVVDVAGHVLSMSSGTVSGQLIPHPLLP